MASQCETNQKFQDQKQSKYMKQMKIFSFKSGGYNISTFCWFREVNNKHDTSNIDGGSKSITET